MFYKNFIYLFIYKKIIKIKIKIKIKYENIENIIIKTI